jgi:Na+/melibiose symporter-like transporter
MCATYLLKTVWSVNWPNVRSQVHNLKSTLFFFFFTIFVGLDDYWTALIPFHLQIFFPFSILDNKFMWRFCKRNVYLIIFFTLLQIFFNLCKEDRFYFHN